MESCPSSIYARSPKKLILMSAKGCCSHRIDELSARVGASRQEAELSFCHTLLFGLPQKVPSAITEGLPSSNTLKKRVSPTNALYLVF